MSLAALVSVNVVSALARYSVPVLIVLLDVRHRFVMVVRTVVQVLRVVYLVVALFAAGGSCTFLLHSGPLL